MLGIRRYSSKEVGCQTSIELPIFLATGQQDLESFSPVKKSQNKAADKGTTESQLLGCESCSFDVFMKSSEGKLYAATISLGRSSYKTWIYPLSG